MTASAPLVAALLALAFVSAPASGQAPARNQPADAVLACGLGDFTAADDRLFGESYAFAKAHVTDRDPPGRDRVIVRLDRQLEVCRRRHGLNEEQLLVVRVYSANQILLRGADSYLRSRAADPAKLDRFAESLSDEEVARNADQAFISGHSASFAEAGIPAGLHAAAADYVIFFRRDIFFRSFWASKRSPTANPEN